MHINSKELGNPSDIRSAINTILCKTMVNVHSTGRPNFIPHFIESVSPRKDPHPIIIRPKFLAMDHSNGIILAVNDVLQRDVIKDVRGYQNGDL